ncbi:cyclin-like protein interacting with PHO85 [Mucor velutinosus]|uniref:Cyclin-like protein interacting with PHO85 n=1 Tax=Mucor velutinosus TaxID=708070 RepID=A0AAN7DKH8_9FUNG|nr:cyclin-like protein interacting with PHO85 [Mucor velutinosus]
MNTPTLPSSKQQQACILYEHYLELRKMREHRLKLLQEQQKRVQQHERGLFRIRNHLAKAVTEVAKVHDKLNQLVESDVWVTAKEHEQIHCVCDMVEREFSDWDLKKRKKHQQIDKEANDAKIHASHIVGIERALLCLEDQMRQQFSEYKSKRNRVHDYQQQQQQQQQQIFLRRSKSQCSFTSIITATSKNSTSLSGALLKKWLQPRLQQQPQPQQESNLHARYRHVAAM